MANRMVVDSGRDGTTIVIEIGKKPVMRVAEMVSRLARKFGVTRVHVASQGIGIGVADAVHELSHGHYTTVADLNVKIDVKTGEVDEPLLQAGLSR